MNTFCETKKAIVELLIPYADLIAWSEFGDRGNPRCNQYDLNDDKQAINVAVSEMYVMLAMPKRSDIHIALSSRVAWQLNCKWVTYDWLKKIVARVLSSGTYDDLYRMITLSKRLSSVSTEATVDRSN